MTDRKRKTITVLNFKGISLLYQSAEIAWIYSKRMTSNPALNDGSYKYYDV